jgi:predicted transcriptional regulator
MGLRSTVKNHIKRQLCELSINAVSEVVYNYIKHNPGSRLCEVSKDLMPHGETSRLFTSHIIKDLVNNGRVVRDDRKKHAPVYSVKQ